MSFNKTIENKFSEDYLYEKFHNNIVDEKADNCLTKIDCSVIAILETKNGYYITSDLLKNIYNKINNIKNVIKIEKIYKGDNLDMMMVTMQYIHKYGTCKCDEWPDSPNDEQLEKIKNTLEIMNNDQKGTTNIKTKVTKNVLKEATELQDTNKKDTTIKTISKKKDDSPEKIASKELYSKTVKMPHKLKTDVEPELLEKLVIWRNGLKVNKLTDENLYDLAYYKPKNEEEFYSISGCGVYLYHAEFKKILTFY